MNGVPISSYTGEHTMNLLHVDASALGPQSVTRQLSARTVEALRRHEPELAVTRRDLAADPLPHWEPATPSDAAQEQSGVILQEFLTADIIVIGAPMYNFGIPSQLKAWIDRVAVAGQTFRYTEGGPEGLAGGKRVIVLSGRGGVYSEGPASAMDHQEAYLRTLFGFLGINRVQIIRAEALNMGEERRHRAIADAIALIDAIDPTQALAA
jgi:FMN-dependent NADH-azoreductase